MLPDKKIFLLLITFIVSGCIKARIDITLNEDSSGILSMEYKVTEKIINDMTVAWNLRNLLIESGIYTNPITDVEYILMWIFNPSEEKIKKVFDTLSPYRIELNRINIKQGGDIRNVSLQIQFPALNTLYIIPFIKQLNPVFNIKTNNLYQFIIPSLSPPDNPVTYFTEKYIIERVTPYLKDFYIKVTINTPGKIIKSNGNIQDNAKSSSWIFDFNKDPNDFIRFQNTSFETIFQPG